MTSVRLCPPLRPRTLGIALIALALPVALLVNSRGKASAEKPASAARRQPTTSATLSVPLSVDWKFTSNFFGSNPASPVIVDDMAYFVSGNVVYAVGLQNGAMKWRYPEDPGATLPKLVLFTPAVGNGMVYLSAGDGLYALTAADGKLAWRFNPAGKSALTTSPIILGNAVYFGAQNNRLYGVDGKTGEGLGGVYKPLNRPAGLDMGGDLSAEPTVMNGNLYYVTANQQIHNIDLSSGVQRWGVPLQADTANATPVFNGDNFFLTAGNTFSCYRAASGQVKWSIPLPADAAAPPVVDSDGTSYVITSDRNMYAINLRGKGVWKQAAHLENRALTRPTLVGDLLIVTTALGGLYAFDKTNGEMKWNYTFQPSSSNPASIPLTTSVAAAPVVVGDTLYTLSDDGTLTSFRHDAPDFTPPTITELEPTVGDYLNGRPPFHISAKIMDDGSGLNLSTLVMKLDDQTLLRQIPDERGTGPAKNADGFLYRPDTSVVEYTTIENENGKSAALSDGHHTVTIIVKDWKGNELNKIWTFFTDDSIRPKPRPTSQPNGNGFPGGIGNPGMPGGKGSGGPPGD